MPRVQHLRREIEENDRHRMYCDRVMTKERYLDQDPDLPMCRRCQDNRLAGELRLEAQAEKHVRQGLLEEDQGPNRRWNEY
jgi:hypothetical protein